MPDLRQAVHANSSRPRGRRLRGLRWDLPRQCGIPDGGLRTLGSSTWRAPPWHASTAPTTFRLSQRAESPTSLAAIQARSRWRNPSNLRRAMRPSRSGRRSERAGPPVNARQDASGPCPCPRNHRAGPISRQAAGTSNCLGVSGPVAPEQWSITAVGQPRNAILVIPIGFPFKIIARCREPRFPQKSPCLVGFEPTTFRL